MRIAQSITELIGETPLLELHRIEEELPARVIVKIESRNPGGSVKDRVALAMIEAAERSGQLAPGGMIVEATSGNTGVGLALVAARRGYTLVLTMPESMSLERRRLLAALGAKIVLTPKERGMQGAVEEAARIARETPGAFEPKQFENAANPAAHAATAREIWLGTDGCIDAFVACIGTGGTVSGTGRILKKYDSAVRVFGVEPTASPLLTEGRSGPHGIQGIGANFVPDTLDRSVLDGVLCVEDEEAMACARKMAQREGVLCGISSGAAVAAALRLAKQDAWRGKTIVALLPDTGERYLSTALFAQEDVHA